MNYPKHPLIGLTPQYDLKKDRIWMRHEYTDSITSSGALPLLLVQYVNRGDISAIADLLDGVLFTGGDDIHPRRYGEEVEPGCGEIAEARDGFELALYAEAVRRDMPVFGICRGIQLINVGAGGTLYQHIDGHSHGVHEVRIERDSLFYDILGCETIMTNSYHHQAVKTPAPCMRAAAYADVKESVKTIEAIWVPEMTFNASVQWHPENTYTEDEYSQKLFDAFVSACAAYKLKK